MGRCVAQYPKDKHLDIRHFNDISTWGRSEFEWSGTREKFLAYPPNASDSKYEYLVKFPKYGENETATEILNCHLGLNLNLDMARYFPCSYHGRKGVITRSFLTEHDALWEMKTLICRHTNRANLAEKKGRHEDVLLENDINNIFLILDNEFDHKVLHKFFAMIGFDCLLGHGDRHWSNYGVKLTFKKETLHYTFAPIYDTASGYLLEVKCEDLKKYIESGCLDDEKWHRPNKKGLCKITCKKNIKTNHIGLFEYILGNSNFKRYIPSLLDPIRRFDIKLVRHLLRNSFPIKHVSEDRKFVILKILGTRKKILDSIIRQKLSKEI